MLFKSLKYLYGSFGLATVPSIVITTFGLVSLFNAYQLVDSQITLVLCIMSCESNFASVLFCLLYTLFEYNLAVYIMALLNSDVSPLKLVLWWFKMGFCFQEMRLIKYNIKKIYLAVFPLSINTMKSTLHSISYIKIYFHTLVNLSLNRNRIDESYTCTAYAIVNFYF